jgi:hypothetical protein
MTNARGASCEGWGLVGPVKVTFSLDAYI